MFINFRNIIILLLFAAIHIITANGAFSQLSEPDKEKLKVFLDEAVEYTNKGDNEKAANSYYKAAVLCLERNKKKQALPYFKEAAKLNLSVNKLYETQKIYSNIGLIYSNLEDYEMSLRYFSSSQKINLSLGKKDKISSGYIDIAYVYLVQGKNKQSILNLLSALEIATEIKHSRLIMICYKLLAENYKTIGDSQKAAEYQEKYVSYREHIKTKTYEEKQEKQEIKTIVELAKSDAEKKAKDLELELIKKNKTAAEESAKRREEALQDSLKIKEVLAKQQKAEKELLQEKDRLKDAELKQAEEQRRNQKLIIAAGSGVIILIILIVIILIISMIRNRKHSKELEATNKEIEEQKKNIEDKNIALTDAFNKIEDQNKDIAQSIDYARNIQKSILPKQDILNSYIEESFIYFEPRDKVSGDYFWFYEDQIMNGSAVPHKKVFVSAIDCTGHGVPGALLSMVSYNILDSIVVQKKNYTPSLILDELHSSIRKTLRQRSTGNIDGMDMALCTYHPDKNLLEFAGAKNPLIYIKDDQVYKIKGDVKPIGGMYFEKTESQSFNNHKIIIDAPTTFYIFSDGYADQVGEDTGKKFMTTKFKTLLYEIHKLPMNDQREVLKGIFERWKGSLPQVDDVMVIGFKLFPK